MRRAGAIALAAGAALAVATALAVSWQPLRQRIVASVPPQWHVVLWALRYGVSVDHDVMIPMPDGVRLATSLYLPRGDERRPTILIRLPYGRKTDPSGYLPAMGFAARGYAVMVQDLRGSGDSGGELFPWRAAGPDGVATLDWIARQPWSDGKVGTFGCSASAESQFALARLRHPALRAMIAGGTGGAAGGVGGRYAYFGVFEGGIFQLASGFGWFVDHGAKDPRAPRPPRFDRAAHLRKLPVRDLVRAAGGAPSAYDDYLATPLGDPLWHRWGFIEEEDRIDAPVMFIDAWADQGVADTLAMAGWLRRVDPAGSRHRVVVFPGTHCRHHNLGTGVDRFGALEVRGGARPWTQWYVAWFDHYLRGGPTPMPQSPYHFFMLGEDRWIDTGEWPPAESRPMRWHLGGGGHANTRAGDGTLAPGAPASEGADAFTYDPANPAPSRGGPVCCTGLPNDPPGPAEQTEVETRADVLVYTSAPLAQPLRFAGPLKAHLTVSSNASDTDLVARLAHVFPDGRSIGIQEGALRLRYRDAITAPRPLEPGKRYTVDVDMRALAYAIPAGHRLRLQVTSSAFPRLERNLNTGTDNAAETRVVVAVNHIHHGGAAESWIELPVLPALAPGAVPAR